MLSQTKLRAELTLAKCVDQCLFVFTCQSMSDSDGEHCVPLWRSSQVFMGYIEFRL
jgi:hypothetical protein